MTISYIPAGVPFLETLAEYVLQKTDPLQLPQCQILLPTQRACEALKQALLKCRGQATLLPKIQALGNLNAEDMVLQGASIQLLKGKISERRRHLLLTHLIATHRDLTTDQAGLLATTLLQLLDTLARERIALEEVDFDQLVAADHALHWQVTGDFLKRIQQEWSRILVTEDKLERYTFENLLLAEQARLLAETPPPYPVIIAGSRGSMPATAHLMKQVACLDQGHIILQGLVPSDCLEELSPTHPQADLQKLLNFLEVNPQEVKDLRSLQVFENTTSIKTFPKLASSPRRREPSISNACGNLSFSHQLDPRLQEESMGPRLRGDDGGKEGVQPSRILEAAFQMNAVPFTTVEGLTLAECASPQQEAEVIALAFREVLETPGKTGMLITPDKSLARRVRMALRRWNIHIKGIEGTPLRQTLLGSLYSLTAQWIHPEFNLGVFLATLKHPLVRDLPIASLEMEVIRKGAWSWDLIIQKSRSTNLEAFIEELHPLVKSCQEAAKASHISFEKVMLLHQQLLEHLLEASPLPALVEYAEDMKTFWEDLQKASHALTISTGEDYSKLLIEYLDQVCCDPVCTHDRIRMVDLMDARLLHADVVILGGLNEGCWPQNLPADPWFNRITRKKIGLPPPEERIGLSAHDFIQAGTASDIILTRSMRVEGTPTVPSSFLVKVQTWLHQQGHDLPVAQALLDWSTPLLETHAPLSAPAPKPPTGMRPRTLSISDMATWMQNPYGIYAKHILGLRPLPSPFEHNDAMIFGTMVHLILQKILPLAQVKASNLSEAVEKIWRQFEVQFQSHERVFWHWRLQQMVEWFIHLPENTQAQISYLETVGHIKIGDFTIVGKIDRVDIREGQAYVIDYKTGVLPSTGFVKYGLSPQLLLEAWIVQDGVMQSVPQTPVTSASLWRLPTGWQNDTRITLEGETLDTFLTQLKEKVERLITIFKDSNTPYLCHPRGRIYSSPYDHLARVQEWSTQDGTND